jgi:hypothetical protein
MRHGAIAAQLLTQYAAGGVVVDIAGAAAVVLGAAGTLAGGALIDEWNPLDKHADIVLSGSNLTATFPNTGDSTWRAVRGTRSHTTGKRYFECRRVTSADGLGIGVLGLATALSALNVDLGSEGGTAWSFGATGGTFGQTFWGGSGSDNSGRAIGNGEWGRIAVDFDAGKIWVGDSVAWDGDPAAGTGNIATFTPPLTLFPAAHFFSQNDEVTVNFGGSAFQFTIPSGFTPWKPMLAGAAAIAVGASGTLTP